MNKERGVEAKNRLTYLWLLFCGFSVLLGVIMKVTSGITNSTSPPRGIMGPPFNFPQILKNYIFMDFLHKIINHFRALFFTAFCRKKRDTKKVFSCCTSTYHFCAPVSVIFISTSDDYFPFWGGFL